MNVRCDYCGKDAKLVKGTVIYPHRRDLGHLNFWHCAPCLAWVGTHKGTTKPLGRLADADLRRWKQRAHAAFDPLWREKKMSRGKAYRWLGDQMGIRNPHIGQFTVEQCKQVCSLCEPRPFG